MSDNLYQNVSKVGYFKVDFLPVNNKNLDLIKTTQLQNKPSESRVNRGKSNQNNHSCREEVEEDFEENYYSLPNLFEKSISQEEIKRLKNRAEKAKGKLLDNNIQEDQAEEYSTDWSENVKPDNLFLTSEDIDSAYKAINISKLIASKDINNSLDFDIEEVGRNLASQGFGRYRDVSKQEIEKLLKVRTKSLNQINMGKNKKSKTRQPSNISLIAKSPEPSTIKVPTEAVPGKKSGNKKAETKTNGSFPSTSRNPDDPLPPVIKNDSLKEEFSFENTYDEVPNKREIIKHKAQIHAEMDKNDSARKDTATCLEDPATFSDQESEDHLEIEDIHDPEDNSQHEEEDDDNYNADSKSDDDNPEDIERDHKSQSLIKTIKKSVGLISIPKNENKNENRELSTNNQSVMTKQMEGKIQRMIDKSIEIHLRPIHRQLRELNRLLNNNSQAVQQRKKQVRIKESSSEEENSDHEKNVSEEYVSIFDPSRRKIEKKASQKLLNKKQKKTDKSIN